MLETLRRLVDEAKLEAARFDTDLVDGATAKLAVALTAEGERVFAAIKTLAMARVDVTGAWAAGADRSAE